MAIVLHIMSAATHVKAIMTQVTAIYMHIVAIITYVAASMACIHLTDVSKVVGQLLGPTQRCDTC